MNFTDFNKKINNEIIGVNHHYVDPQVPRNDDDILSKNQELVSEGKQQFFIWYSEGNEDNGNIYILINLVKNRDGKKNIHYRRFNSNSTYTFEIDDDTDYFYEIPNEYIHPELLKNLLGTHYRLSVNNHLISTDTGEQPQVGGKNKKKSKNTKKSKKTKKTRKNKKRKT